MERPAILGILAGVGVMTLALLPRRAQAMTDIATQDTSNVPKAADFNADINVPALVPPSVASTYSPPVISDPAALVPLAEADDVSDWLTRHGTSAPAVAPSWSWEGDWIAQVQSQGVPVLPSYSWEDGWVPQDGGLPVYVPWEDNYPQGTPADTSYDTLEEKRLMQRPAVSVVGADNLAAFLYMIRCCEHLYPQNVVNDACYNIFYSGNSNVNPPALCNQRFYNYADHPVKTGECKRVPLPDGVCQRAGLGPGCTSSAAGAYQIILPTWEWARKQPPALADFSPTSQDEAAIRILIRCGAFPYILNGDFDNAIARASVEWASLPKATTGQNPKQMIFAIDRFNEGMQRVA